MNNLSDETIICISELLSDAKTKFSFAQCNKRMWNILTAPRLKPYTLMASATAMDIKQTETVLVVDRHYSPEFVSHFFKYAINLKSVTFDNRARFKISFIQMFLVINQKCVFYVPASVFNLFNSVVDDSDNKNIIVRTSLRSDNIEHIKTPEEVIRRVEVFKNIEKLKYFESLQHSVIISKNLSHLVHASVNRLFDATCYKLLQNEDIQAMLTKEEIDNAEAKLIVTMNCPKFVETVVIINEFWFLCTSFCAFIHKKELDDCADKSRIGFQTKPVSFVRRKTRSGSDYFELTIRIGMIELLVTSGFFGPINDSTVEAFFGSSIPNLPLSISADYNTASTNSLFIPVPTKQHIRRARLLNQYIKAHSSYDWMFISTRFYNEGYAPYHPLHFKNDNCIQESASLLLRAFVYNVLYSEDIAVAKLDILRQRNKKDTVAAKLVVKYITDLSCCDELNIEKYDKSRLKADMLQIYESILAGAIKRKNKILAKKATSEYTVSSSTLFD